MTDKVPDGNRRVPIDNHIPTPGLIGFRTEFLTMTQGAGLMYSVFDHYGPHLDINIGQRHKGSLISNGQGKALAFAIFNLQERGKMMIGHAEEVYEGQVIGIHTRENDLVVNPLKAKQLNNIRAAGTDENLILVTPIRLTLEQAIEFINDDELIEITPLSIRIRKRLLSANERKRASRG
jgi:GTP-binding protein